MNTPHCWITNKNNSVCWNCRIPRGTYNNSEVKERLMLDLECRNIVAGYTSRVARKSIIITGETEIGEQIKLNLFGEL